MAVLTRIENPADWPEGARVGIVEGYQRQNTHIYAARVGLDTAEPYDDGNGGAPAFLRQQPRDFCLFCNRRIARPTGTAPANTICPRTFLYTARSQTA